MAAGHASEQVLKSYERDVAEVVHELSAHESPSKWAGMMRLADGSVVRVDQGSGRSHDAWSPKLFDALHARHKPPVTPVANALRAGIGAPLDGVHSRASHKADAHFVFKKGEHLAVTAVIEFGNPTTPPVLHLYDPREVSTIKVGGHEVRLAADFLLPVEKVFNKRSFLNEALTGLFRPERFMADQGLYMLEPYRADKVPVVFVHGLMSDPHIWENEVLSLMADPELGKRVQCWCFMYPTGLPVANSAMRLRNGMEEARKTFDFKGSDPGFKRTVMVGHSMGGLLTRMQVEDSGEAYWRTWFKVPPAQVPLNGEISRVMHEALLFKANPQIKEVVFIATPHRGSKMADGWLGRLGSYLIRVPQQIVQIGTSVATLDVEMLAPERLAMSHFGITSISTLSPRHPMFGALNSCPMKAPCHSIIGTLGSRKPLLETSDGVVPYTSSHLDEAKSEKTIPYWHGCVERIECAEEVTRIVREHLHALN